MRPYLEHLPVPPGASWSMLNRRLDEAIPFQWHHHPEFELTLTMNSEGQRFIGDHVGSYGQADLVLVGPNLPHTWASRTKIDDTEPHTALVFWFRKEWIEGLIAGSVELQRVQNLIDRSAGGLAFLPETAAALTAEFESIFSLPPMQRLLALLSILTRLAEAEDARQLSRTVPKQLDSSRSRIDRVLAHLHRHYARPTDIGELAEIAALSVSGLHRMFVKHTQVSVTEYVAGLRIGEACSRLSSTSEPIAFIADAVRYPSLANFNRQFKAQRSMTPRDYRSMFRK